MSSIETRVAELEEQVKQLMTQLETKTKATKGEKKEKEPKATKREKEPKKNMDGSPKKKRGTTGYLLFAKETRPLAKNDITNDENPSPKPTEVVTEIAKRWKALSDDEREEWNKKANAENTSSDEE